MEQITNMITAILMAFLLRDLIQKVKQKKE